MEFNFAQNQTVDSLDTVPETFRAAYEEKDGKFSVRTDLAGIVGALDGVNGALKKERGITTTLKQQKDATAALKELGFDSFDAVKARIDELGAAVAAKANVDPAKIKNEIEQTFQTERDGFKTTLAGMEDTLFKYLVRNEALGALNTAKGNADLLMPHIERVSRVVKDDASGEYVVRILDGEGQYRGDGKGGFMQPKDLVAELRSSKTFGVAFESDASGGGADPKGQPASRGAQQQHQRQQQNEGRNSVDKIAGGLAKLEGRA